MAERKKITAREVANLDPFGKRGGAAEELKSLLGVSGERGEELGWKRELIRQEEEAWTKVLGTKIEVTKPIPQQITPEVGVKLSKEGFEIVFIPQIDLLPFNQSTPEEYLEDLVKKYPNWRPSEDNHTIVRNLDKMFWEYVKDGSVNFPALHGKWMAVEVFEKPPFGSRYPPSTVTTKLGFEDRWGIYWDDLKAAIDWFKKEILDGLGVQSGDLRLLDALEWNLLGNRNGWGKSDSWEWVNTEYRAPKGINVFSIGCSTSRVSAGTGRVGTSIPHSAFYDTGFRVAVEFGEGQGG